MDEIYIVKDSAGDVIIACEELEQAVEVARLYDATYTAQKILSRDEVQMIINYPYCVAGSRVGTFVYKMRPGEDGLQHEDEQCFAKPLNAKNEKDARIEAESEYQKWMEKFCKKNSKK